MRNRSETKSKKQILIDNENHRNSTFQTALLCYSPHPPRCCIFRCSVTLLRHTLSRHLPHQSRSRSKARSRRTKTSRSKKSSNLAAARNNKGEEGQEELYQNLLVVAGSNTGMFAFFISFTHVSKAQEGLPSALALDALAASRACRSIIDWGPPLEVGRTIQSTNHSQK